MRKPKQPRPSPSQTLRKGAIPQTTPEPQLGRGYVFIGNHIFEQAKANRAKEAMKPSVQDDGAWAKGAHGADPVATLETFQNGLTVRLIATERSEFETCTSDETLKIVVNRNRQHNFDYLPVLEPISDTNRKRLLIIGLVYLVPYMKGISEPQGLVREQMRPLSEENLIGADASILAFIRNADSQQCRLVVSGSEISGLVSLSDLQRLPVRAALFGMVTHLEIMMANSIRREFGQCSDWINRLPKKRRVMLGEKTAVAKRDEPHVDELLFTQFYDKILIIEKRPDCQWNTGSFAADLRRIEGLRNDLAHANDYASAPDAAKKVCEIVRLMETWTKRLTVT